MVAVNPVSAQTAELISLTIKLRHSDGTAVVGETIILERLPEEKPISPNCITDAGGTCSWNVKRGLYQLLMERPLDNISSLAVAEGGLRGFGITVGDENITYHFTLHSDSRVYFDAAPEAAVPSPIIPAGEMLHGGTAQTPELPVVDDALIEETSTPEPTRIPDTAIAPSSGSAWRLILFIASGLAIGGGLHLLWLRSELALSGPAELGKPTGQAWPPKRQTSSKQAQKPKVQATSRANDEEANHS